MNKKITIYELLGLIKDNKIAKKIKYDGKIYEFKEIEEGTGYVYESGIIKEWLSNIIEIDNIKYLNNKVEIIEENKKIKKLKIKDDKLIGNWENGSGYCYTLSAPQTVLTNKINELIDAVNELIKEE